MSRLALGIDTSGREAGAALLRGSEVLGARAAPGPHSATLLPMVRELLASAGVTLSSLDVVGVARGPGSYTGLRVGVVTAKVLGRVSGATVMGVPTLEVVASLAPAHRSRVVVLLRAYKRRVLTCAFVRSRAGGGFHADGEPCLVEASAASLPGEGGPLLVTDALDLVGEGAGAGGLLEVHGPAPEAVALHAVARAATGAPDESYTLAPDYLRPPSLTLPRKGRS